MMGNYSFFVDFILNCHTVDENLETFYVIYVRMLSYMPATCFVNEQ